MALGSEDERRRKQLKTVLPKNDWKQKVRGSADARSTVEIIQGQLAKTPDGKYLIDAFTATKIRQLDAYERYCIRLEELLEDMEKEVPTLREYLNEIKHEHKE